MKLYVPWQKGGGPLHCLLSLHVSAVLPTMSPTLHLYVTVVPHCHGPLDGARTPLLMVGGATHSQTSVKIKRNGYGAYKLCVPML